MSKYDDVMPKLKALVLSSDSENVPDVPAADIKYARAFAQLLEAEAKVGYFAFFGRLVCISWRGLGGTWGRCMGFAPVCLCCRLETQMFTLRPAQTKILHYFAFFPQQAGALAHSTATGCNPPIASASEHSRC